jgi:hypothetical protein
MQLKSWVIKVATRELLGVAWRLIRGGGWAEQARSATPTEAGAIPSSWQERGSRYYARFKPEDNVK